jgi:hypothetical protein
MRRMREANARQIGNREFATARWATRLRRLWLVASAASSLVMIGLGLPHAAQAEVCLTDEVRTGPSAALPDCRAYELVSPAGFEPWRGHPWGYAAAVTGDRIAYYSKAGAPPGSPTYGPYFLAKRGPSGWSTEDVIPPQTTASGDLCHPFIDYSPDLSRGVLSDGWNWGEGYPRYNDDSGSQNCSHDEPELVEGEPRGAQNLFLRDNEARSYRLVNVTPLGLAARDAYFQGGSTDLSHIVFTSPLPLTAGAPTPPAQPAANEAVGEDLYEWVDGRVQLLTVLPGGEPTWGLLANGSESHKVTDATVTHAVSADGERAFFYAGGEIASEHYLGGNLYLRTNAGQSPLEECMSASRACTVQVDASQGGGESGGGRFQWATPDGARAFFTDERQLTPDAKAQPGKPDLYEYDLTRPPGDRLVDLTSDASEPANVQGLSGISDDGSSLYFVADGVLSGEQANSHGDRARAGEPNLYLLHATITTFIATLAPFEAEPGGIFTGDSCDWDSAALPSEFQAEGIQRNDCLSSRITPDGRFLAFNSLRELTGFDNVVQGTGERDNEIFLFDAVSNTLACASCEPHGAPPTALHARGEFPDRGPDPRLEPLTEKEQWQQTQGYLPRQLADDGTVFFDTTNRLVEADENGTSDVYEYRDGQLRLISSGRPHAESYFRDADPSGSNVFLISTEALVSADGDNTMSLYDARVGGGFAEPAPPVICGTEAQCRPPYEGLAPVSPSSANFSGPGNPAFTPSKPPPRPTRCKRGFRLVKVHGHKVCRRLHKRHKHGGQSRVHDRARTRHR